MSAKKPTAGKGRKFCPGCHKIIGASNRECPECHYVFPPKGGKPAEPLTPSVDTPIIDELQFIRVMIGKGFPFLKTINAYTGEPVGEPVIPEKIKALDLQFKTIPRNASGVYVTQTSPQIQISMDLDTFLRLSGIRPS